MDRGFDPGFNRDRTTDEDATNFTSEPVRVTIGVMGGRRSLLALIVALTAVSGCAETLPDKVVLRAEAANVEVINEPPTPTSTKPPVR